MNGVNAQTTPVEDHRLLLVSEAAERLGLSRTTVYSLIDSGELPTVRFGRAVRVDPTDLAALIERRKTKAEVGP